MIVDFNPGFDLVERIDEEKSILTVLGFGEIHCRLKIWHLNG